MEKRTKLDRYYYGIRYEAIRVYEIRNEKGGDWRTTQMANMPVAEDETRNIVYYTLKKTIKNHGRVAMNVKYGIYDEAKAEKENEIFEIMETFLRRRIQSYKD